MIREDSFIRKMTARWESLGNCISDPLKENWKQLCQTLNEQAKEGDSLWRVLQLATGTGKSQGVAVYCSMLGEERAFGTLIVVRLIAQAEEMATLINELAGKHIATARHSDNTMTNEAMAATQILVVTHKAYELALDTHAKGDEQRLTRFTDYGGNFQEKRQLVIIDECLDVVKQYQVNLEKLSLVLGAIPQRIKREPSLIKEIDSLESLKKDLERASATPHTKVVHHEPLALPKGFTLTRLRAELRKVEWDHLLYGKESVEERKAAADRFDKTLEDAQATLEQWNYYAKKGAKHTLNTSSLVIADESQGAVVLDATASHTLLYKLSGGRARVYPALDSRTYKNVTLHVARVSGVGKTKMKKYKADRCQQLIDDLTERLPDSAKVFVCCHKDIEPLLAAYQPPFEVRTGHWGAIEGLNNYQDCDTFVCFGLPYRDRTSAINTYCAFNGVQDDDWLSTPSLRGDHGHDDICVAIEQGQMASDVIQAINRIRVRRVTDTEGNCEPADCYLMLQTGKHGDTLLQAITSAMPGIKNKEWAVSFDGEREKGLSKLRSQKGRSLLKFLELEEEGEWSSSTLKERLSISKAQWRKIAEQLRLIDSPLTKNLSNIGCRYLTEGAGRGARSYIIKTPK